MSAGLRRESSSGNFQLHTSCWHFLKNVLEQEESCGRLFVGGKKTHSGGSKKKFTVSSTIVDSFRYQVTRSSHSCTS